jgi:hypothetical protein
VGYFKSKICKMPKKIHKKQIRKMDETEYLFSTEANKTRLLKSLENADKSENLTEINLKDFKKQLSVK